MPTRVPFTSYNNIYIKSLAFLIIAFVTSVSLKGQKPAEANGKKQITAIRAASSPKMDGVLDDEIWNTSMVAEDFIVYMPYNGKKSSMKTRVRVLYDNVALYVGAFMYDPNPDSIYLELGERDADRLLNADNFSVEVSPYNDGVNGFRFKVSASGVQSDNRIEQNDFGMGGGGGGLSGGGGGGGGGGAMTGGGGSGGSGGRQDTWDAVWESKVALNPEGWTAEIRIPYSALRFPKDDIQTWGINFWREIRRTREQSSWNFVDRNIGSTINHLGELTEIKNIEPPLRLSLTPYVSGYLEKSTGEKGAFTYNGGLDMKIGLNESFTIDATLVPDFGQVQSDDQVLNLTPYEVKYNEKRPFFMEGTELFSKGDIFYSRRIGSRPRQYYSLAGKLDQDEIITENPQESSLINATKLSGRTRFGLGIGVFNAMTKEMFATVNDTIAGSSRQISTEPFTNFNMLVLDQNLKNNSYISLVNTNVWRNHARDLNYYTANVTGTDFMIRNSSKLYSISGKAAISQKYYDELANSFGHSYNMRVGKTGGNFRVEYTLRGISKDYDPNDMGYLRRNNEFENELQVAYNVTKPVWKINSSRNSIQYTYSQLYSPRVFTRSEISMSSFTVFKNYMDLNLRLELAPGGSDDYYEPRIDGWFFHKGPEIMSMVSLSSNRNKRIYLSSSFSYTDIKSEYDQNSVMFTLNPGFRFTDRFQLTHQFLYMKSANDLGYVSYDGTEGDIYFGKRDNRTISNTLSTGYTFTATSYFTLRLRHYWSTADYNGEYYILQNNGSLNPVSYSGVDDNNYNSFNIDFMYNWRFAPGSDITFVWKNAIYSSGDFVYSNFGDNLSNMFDSPKINSFSIKILYYLDYQNIKNLKKNK